MPPRVPVGINAHEIPSSSTNQISVATGFAAGSVLDFSTLRDASAWKPANSGGRFSGTPFAAA